MSGTFKSGQEPMARELTGSTCEEPMARELTGSTCAAAIILLSRHSLKLPSIFVALYPQLVKLSDLTQKLLCIADSGWLSQKLTTVQSTKKSVYRVFRCKGDI